MNRNGNETESFAGNFVAYAIREGRWLERRPSIGPNVGIFVGISTFHIGLSFWKITSIFNKVAVSPPAIIEALISSAFP
jgi:hypothetical protein